MFAHNILIVDLQLALLVFVFVCSVSDVIYRIWERVRVDWRELYTGVSKFSEWTCSVDLRVFINIKPIFYLPT